VLSMIASHTLVTVYAGHTRAVELSTALGVLGNVHVQPVGIVLGGAGGFLGDFRRFRGIRARPPAEITRRRNGHITSGLATATLERSSPRSIIDSGGDARATTPFADRPRHRRHADFLSLSAGDTSPTPARQFRRFRGIRARTPADFPRRQKSRVTSAGAPVGRPPSTSVIDEMKVRPRAESRANRQRHHRTTPDGGGAL
jgi:hypothetical protein